MELDFQTFYMKLALQGRAKVQVASRLSLTAEARV